MKKRYWMAGALGLAGAAVAVKMLRRPVDVVWDEHADALHHAERSRFVDVGGVRVHYQEAGAFDAKPVLLLHGFTASNFVWKDVLVPLAEGGFRVVAPDLLGFGFSGKPRDGEYTIGAQARMVVGLMNALGIERAALVGSSYGGAVAATCALDYPERVERLVLVDAVINDHARNRPLLRLAAAPLIGDLVSPLMMGSRRLLRSQLRKGYAPENRHLFDETRATAHHRPLLAASTQRAAVTTLRRWRASRIAEEAHRITQPTLLVWGEADPVIPLAHGRQLNRAMPDSRLRIFRRCGHMPMEERPQKFVEVVAHFLGEGKKEAGALSAKA
ncbi:MAG TPA: alpha/beta hydrolase [Pyrinomonadaceae bacterium]|nr:alpha/beta hydrolase [Pyrinomonadaceae bacterium]